MKYKRLFMRFSTGALSLAGLRVAQAEEQKELIVQQEGLVKQQMALTKEQKALLAQQKALLKAKALPEKELRAIARKLQQLVHRQQQLAAKQQALQAQGMGGGSAVRLLESQQRIIQEEQRALLTQQKELEKTCQELDGKLEELTGGPKVFGEVTAKFDNKKVIDKNLKQVPSATVKLGVKQEIGGCKNCKPISFEGAAKIKHERFKKAELTLPLAFASIPMLKNQFTIGLGRNDSKFNGDHKRWQVVYSSPFTLDRFNFGLSVEFVASTMDLVKEIEKEAAKAFIDQQYADIDPVLASQAMQRANTFDGFAFSRYKASVKDVPLAVLPWMTFEGNRLKVGLTGMVGHYAYKINRLGAPAEEGEARQGPEDWYLSGGAKLHIDWAIVKDWTNLKLTTCFGKGISSDISDFAGYYARWVRTNQKRGLVDNDRIFMPFAMHVGLKAKQFLLKDKLDLSLDASVTGAGEELTDQAFKDFKDGALMNNDASSGFKQPWAYKINLSPKLTYHFVKDKASIHIGGDYRIFSKVGKELNDGYLKEHTWGVNVGMKAKLVS